MHVWNFLSILLIHFTAAQFPEHVDLQKMGEIIFNNEKHNILKPTVHKITDHFVDVMQRSENKNINERVFLDDNGFRHFWSGLGGKTESLRKTDILLYKVNDNFNRDEINAPDDVQLNENVANTALSYVKRSGIDVANEATNENSQVKNKETNNVNDDLNENIKTTVTKNKRRPKRPKNSLELDEEEKALRDTKKTDTAPAPNGKKKARITFFCPFFGVMTMTKYVD